ncbi:MAG: ABC transporter ATP-binding protein [Erysipelotrichales bacterium]|nr:ABC transporter ATP-binding protein [Erysipelotrichales bacterium]
MKHGNDTTLKKLLRMTGKYRGYLFLSIVLAVLTCVLTLYAPILFGDTIDFLIGKDNVDFARVGTYLMRILAVILAASLGTWIMNLVNNTLTFRVVEDIRAAAIRKIQVLPMKYLDAHSSGDIVSRVIADTDQLSEGLLMGLTQLFSGITTIGVTLGFMLARSWKVTFLVIVLTPISFLVARFIASHTYEMFKRQTETRGKQTSLVNEIVENEKIVQAFGYGKKASARFRALNEELEEYSRKAVFFSSLTNPCTRAVNSVIYAAVALMGSHLILTESLTVGGLSILLAYANQYMKPFNDISSVVTEFQNSLACAARVFELIEAEPEPAEKDAELPSKEGNVSLRRVYFRYTEDRPLIEDFSLDVKEGEHVAIVGPTGCGKTTMINLLMRFYDVDEGSILIGETDIRDVKRHSLRSVYGMVLQETWLENGTIRENIAFGKPDATDEEIIAAAKKAHSWSFIRRIPGRLDAVIHEGSLSEGQKQLLCITRVMLALPPVLILDEATSSIDTLTEIRIQKAFDELMKGRTSFIVAHRLSTIRNADTILVMNDGHIVEQGNHQELMKKDGFYARLYNSQFAPVTE